MTAHSLHTWYKTPIGKKIAHLEAELLADVLSTSFGYHLLQLGENDVATASFLKTNRILNYSCMVASPRSKCADLLGSYRELPFLSDAIDWILIPHLLEFSLHPNRILKEACRVLVPEGSMLILGFNPWSLWGLWQYFKSQKRAPWSGRFISLRRLKQQFKKLNCEIVEEKTFFFRPPFKRVKTLKWWRFLEILGQYCWPFAGGVYMIIAKKKVVTPIWVGRAWPYTLPIKAAYPQPVTNASTSVKPESVP